MSTAEKQIEMNKNDQCSCSGSLSNRKTSTRNTIMLEFDANMRGVRENLVAYGNKRAGES